MSKTKQQELDVEKSRLIQLVQNTKLAYDTARRGLADHKTKMERILEQNKIGRQTTLSEFTKGTIDCTYDEKGIA